MLFVSCLFLVFPLLSSAQEPLQSFPLHEIRVLKIAAAEERAVVKTPEGELHIIKVGDVIGDRHGMKGSSRCLSKVRKTER